MTSITRAHVAKPYLTLSSICAGLLLASGAQAIELGSHPDWMIKLDGTYNHVIGMRAKSADHRLYNNPLFDESEGKFRHSGDIVTNRSSLLGELDVSYQNRYGFRVSGSVWKDFAYDDEVKANPALAAAGYAPGYSSGKYTSYTKKYYLEGGELLDAFVFANIDLGDRDLSVKAGRMTNTWGIALFQAFHAISYSQNSLNLGKQLATPGAHVSELFLPREQVYLSMPLTDDLTIAAQWFWDWESNRLPEGGTYLGFADNVFYGPDRMAIAGVPFPIPRSNYYKPKKANGNHGIALRWQPEWLKGTLGAYYRRMDEMQPWGPYVTTQLTGVPNPPVAPNGYGVSYNEGVDLFGFSIDRGFGAISWGAEISYRMDTALNSSTLLPPGITGQTGAMGNTLHLVTNALVGLSSTPFYDTGTAVIELAWGHLDKITENEQLYKGEGYAGCVDSSNNPQNKWDGCSTDDAVNLSAAFSPEWLQVRPGLDLSMPTSITWGVYGNGANLSGGFQGSTVTSIALNAKLHNKYNFRLGYTHYKYDEREAEVSNGFNMFPGGNGYYFLNDRQWVSLSFQTSF